MMIVMRTTVNLPDDIYRAARTLARFKEISLGDALAELARRGLQPPVSINADKPFPCFELPKGSPPITLEQALAAEDEL